MYQNKMKYQVRPDTVVHVWKVGYQNELTKVTAKGFHAILSSPWYLNDITTGPDWHGIYAIEPTAFNGTNAQKARVMGGEACMWGEYVDASNLIARMWPRSSAVAERLWSLQSIRSLGAAVPRLEEHRCRMVRRGINAEPSGPSFCRYEPQIYYIPRD